MLCHLGETYSKAYEFFYEDIAPHKLLVHATLTASASQSRFPSRQDLNHATMVLDFGLCEQHALICRLEEWKSGKVDFFRCRKFHKSLVPGSILMSSDSCRFSSYDIGFAVSSSSLLILND